MPGPQSTAFFMLLMVVFGALVCWAVFAKHMVFRLLAACLAFIPAVTFGVAAVNKYYDYYQNWDSAIADITSQGTGQAAGVPGTHVGASSGVILVDGNYVYTKLAAADGFTLHLVVHGKLSGLTRTVYVYLPPQYFQPAYLHYRFPAIELIHGFPGQPQDWISVLDITSTLRSLIAGGRARPVVLVMPDASGGRGDSLQCLNQVGGPQDASFIATDVPFDIAHVLRVWPPGRAWGIAGYSEGGYCAANLGVQYGYRFSFAGVLSGYFQPMHNRLGWPPHPVWPFGRNKELLRRNTPTEELLALNPGSLIPQFWIGAGTQNVQDVRAAQIFRQIVQLRQPNVVLKLVKGGGHTMFVWRMLAAPMLAWMTPKLAANVVVIEQRLARWALLHRPCGAAAASNPAHPRCSPSPTPKPTPKASRHPARRRH